MNTLNDIRKRAEALFQAAVDLSAQERSRFLQDCSEGDDAVLAEVRSLLRFYDATSTMHTPAALSSDPSDPLIGSFIGPYRLVEMIGEGGFGSVYAAEQESPIRRRVAVKIIKLGMDTKQVIARFEAERQALAIMDHPGIARVLDAGTTDSGRPYFVMELVAGKPISRLPSTATTTAFRPRSDSDSSCRSVGPSSMHTRRESSTATSNPRTCSWQFRTGQRRRRSSISVLPKPRVTA